MPDHYYSTSKQQSPSPTDVAVTTSTTAGATYEFRIKDGVAGNKKVQALNALEAIRNKIVVSNELV